MLAVCRWTPLFTHSARAINSERATHRSTDALRPRFAKCVSPLFTSTFSLCRTCEQVCCKKMQKTLAPFSASRIVCGLVLWKVNRNCDSQALRKRKFFEKTLALKFVPSILLKRSLRNRRFREMQKRKVRLPSVDVSSCR